MVIASLPLNDDFVHRTLAMQLLAGELPMRDFLDVGGMLSYGIAAGAQLLFGHRLLSEAVVLTVMMAFSTFLVFALVRDLTGSTIAAALSAVLLVVAGLRGYAYPKMVVYAVAAALWWSYVREPTRGKMLLLGAWVAVAFYWRPDHAVYVAIGAALAAGAAHGLHWLVAIRLGQAAAVSLVGIAPVLVLASVTIGLGPYIQAGVAIGSGQHVTTNTHAWPRWPIRRLPDIVRLDAAEAFAPTVSLRWTEGSSAAERSAVVNRYGLTPVADDGPLVQVVRLSDASPSLVRGLINEPVVADTAGIDRGRSAVPWSTWPIWDRWRFSYWWLRFRLFTGVSEHTRAGEAVAALFYGLPLVVIVGAIWLQRYLQPVATAPRLLAFALFGVITAFGLMRTPYDVRAVDDVVVPSILFGLLIAAAWRSAAASRGLRRGALVLVSVVFAVLVVKSVAVAGQFADRVGWLTGDGRSLSRTVGAWSEVRDRLLARPPLTYWDGKPTSPELQLARYANECVPSSRRLLVLWFAPEIYYYADRLMATRELMYETAQLSLALEERLMLEKFQRFTPPLVFVAGGLERMAGHIYPTVIERLRHDYAPAGSVEDDGQRYQVFLRKNETVVRSYGDHAWPCLI
jgi:hypothetical protein